MIRDVIADDKEWLLRIVQMQYSDYGWNYEDASRSFDYVLGRSDSLLIRGDKTFLYAFMVPRMHDYSRRDGYVDLLAGEGNAGREVIELLKCAIRWKEENGIERLTLSSITQHKFGKILMRRLGATPRIVYDL